MPATRPNLFGSGRKESQRAKPAPRAITSELRAEAKRAGYKGVDFKDWVRFKGFDYLSAPSSLYDHYQSGVEQREAEERSAHLKTQAKDLNRQFLDKLESGDKTLKMHKGYKIGKTPDGEYFSSLDPESWYETPAAVKRSIDDYLKQRNPTDRALRYRAVRNMPEHERRCAFCGAKSGLIEAGHVDGHEEHGEPDNLTWTCRPCNVEAGNTLRDAGLGRLTHQYNPSKSGGASNVGEWLQAVGAITPHKGAKYAGSNYGLTSTMSVGDAVAMIRATPHGKRSQFAAQLRKHMGARAAERWNPGKRFDIDDLQDGNWQTVSSIRADDKNAALRLYRAQHPEWTKGRKLRAREIQRNPDHKDEAMQIELVRTAETTRSIEELRRLHSYALQNRNENLLEAVEARATKLNIHHSELTKRNNPVRRTGDLNSIPTEGINLFRDEEAKDLGPEAASATVVPVRGDKDLKWRKVGADGGSDWFRTNDEALHFVQHHYWGYLVETVKRSRRNPEDAADRFYEKFHGQPPTETVEIRTEIHEHEHTGGIGPVVEFWVVTETGLLSHIEFDEDDMPLLSANEQDYEEDGLTIKKGTQLFIDGGDTELDLKAMKMDGPEWVKDRMVIGRFAPPDKELGIAPKAGQNPRKHNITYQTRKEFDSFELIDYQHDLGEETGNRPFLEYEPRNKKLYITGGQYRIEIPVFGISPGIEN